MLPPTKTNFGGTIWHPDKTTSLYYEFSPDKTTKTTSLYYEVKKTDRITHGQREGGRDRRRHELKTSWLLTLPPKGLELCVNFWRYREFDAGKKGMGRCFVKGYGSIPNRRKWFDAGSKGII